MTIRRPPINRVPTLRNAQAGARPTVRGRMPGAATIQIGGAPKRIPSPRQIAKAKAKLEHAASGHASVAAQHRARAQRLGTDDAEVSSHEPSPATLLRMAAAHDEIVAKLTKQAAALG